MVKTILIMLFDLSSLYGEKSFMAEHLTKSAARNIFYGGSIFFLIILIALTVHSHFYMKNVATDESTLTESVVRGKHVWERNSCINLS